MVRTKKNAPVIEPVLLPDLESIIDNSDGAGALPIVDVDMVTQLTPDLIVSPTMGKQGKQKLRRVAICGFAESSRDMANHLDDDVEVWSLNRCYTFLNRWDRWYEVHEEELISGKTGLREKDYPELLQKSQVPIYMRHLDPSVPMARLLPLDEMVASGLRKYFTTSISYMLAHAVYEHDQGQKIKEIALYGIDMSAFSEYSYQRPSVEYWCGMCEGRGMKIIIPDVSPVLKGPLYGDSSSKVLRDVMSDRIQTIKATKAELAADMQGGSGALHELVKFWPELRMNPIYKGRYKDREKALNQIINQTTADINNATGQERECQHWLSYVGANQRAEDEPDAVQLPRAH